MLALLLLLAPSPLAQEPTAPALSMSGTTASGSTSPAASLAARVGTTCGNPYSVAEISFAFEVVVDGELKLRREHQWFPRQSRVIVRWREGGQAVEVELSQLYPYIASTAPQEQAIQAYMHWVNDSYWLLAACKAQDPGVVQAIDAQGRLQLSFEDGTGLTSLDRYWLTVGESGRVEAWEFELQGGRHARFSWLGYARVGPLLLSTRRLSDDGHVLIRFMDLRVR